ncbi:hypothetical protein K469DRAFT_706808 [Zopfia rhizophila CBS 207.26]|uniref:Uncharacterized protein n=1 Tax=Zopfia rhizophila CBS 207.26 TaxID=1314779 RepID=A0A6A6E6E8_9PEZI|nr:hypothetical protein K469DRAFT_706808 [Zopfia rhizophila CBS 207.26]
MQETKPTTSVTRLSEENLRLHNAAYPKDDGYFQVNLIREERARAFEQEMYRQVFGDIDGLEDADFNIEDGDIALRRTASLDALRLYHGSFASSQTPMNRFMTLSPAHDTHPWLARNAMDEAGIGHGDLETLDLRKLASEMVNSEEPPNTTQEASMGSLQPSSDTLSISRFKEIRNARKEGPRTRKRIGIRKHNLVDRSKTPQSKPPNAGK